MRPTVKYASSDGTLPSLPCVYVAGRHAQIACGTNGESVASMIRGANQLRISSTPVFTYVRGIVPGGPHLKRFRRLTSSRRNLRHSARHPMAMIGGHRKSAKHDWTAMSNLSVTFLGKSYELPDSILAYNELLECTKGVRDRLFDEFLEMLVHSKDGFIPDEEFDESARRAAAVYVERLCSQGVFDRTISDYLRDSSGRELIAQVNKAAFEADKQRLIRQFEDWKTGYEAAVEKRTSSVEGLGFSIWSGSFIDHAIYAAMDASTANKQDKEAARRYESEMSALQSSLDARGEREKSFYIKSAYIPAMREAASAFASELMDRHVADLIAAGRFNREALKFTDFTRSCDLLENLAFTDDKKSVLGAAFLACPFNPQVYLTATEMGLMGTESLQTAKLFRQDGTVSAWLADNCVEASYPGTFSIRHENVSLLAAITGRDARDILSELTDDYCTAIVDEYHSVVEFASSNDTAWQMKQLKKAGVEAADLPALAGAEGKTKIVAHVEGIVSRPVLSELTNKCGHGGILNEIRSLCPGADSLANKHDIDCLYAERLRAAIAHLSEIHLEKERSAREEAARQAELEASGSQRGRAQALRVAVAFMAATFFLILWWFAVYGGSTTRGEQVDQDTPPQSSAQKDANEPDAERASRDAPAKSTEENAPIDWTEESVHGLAFSVPASWETRMSRDLAAVESDPDTVKSTFDRNGSHTAWYIKYYGEYASIRDCVDDNWSYSETKRKEFETKYVGISVEGCDEAYSLDETTSDGSNRIIDYLVRCGESVFLLEYFAGPADSFDEGQLDTLLGSVDFTGYQPTPSAAAQNEEDIPALIDGTNGSISKFVDIMGQKGSGGLADEEVNRLGGGEGVFLMGRTGTVKMSYYGHTIGLLEWSCDDTVTPDEYRAFNDLLDSYFGFEGEYSDDGDLCEWDNVTDLLIAYSYRHDDGSIGVDWRLADLSNV